MKPFPEIEITTTFSLYWYDPEQTIHVLEVFRGWTWAEAYDAIRRQNEALAAATGPTYAIVAFGENASILPKGGDVFYHLRKLVRLDPGKEDLCIFVGDVFLVKTMVTAVQTIMPEQLVTKKYRYATSLEAALQCIEIHANNLKTAE
jgi:hypothetical protein